MNRHYRVRPAREEDASAILTLLHPIITHGSYTVMRSTFTIQEQTEYIRQFDQRGIYNVAVNSRDSIVGIQAVEQMHSEEKAFRHVGEISTFVALEQHRQGIGRLLSTTTFREAKKQGFLKLIAMIRADNPRALSFYQSLGFTVVGTAQKHACVNGKFIDEVITEILLNE